MGILTAVRVTTNPEYVKGLHLRKMSLHWADRLLFCGCLLAGSMSMQAENGDAVSGVEACLQQLGAQPISSGALPGQFRLVSWNIEKGNDSQWVDDLLKAPRPLDLILLQEAYQPSVFGDLLMPGVHERFSEGFLAKDLQTGVLSVSRVAPDLHCTLTAYEPWLGTPKATSVTRYGIGTAAQQLLVINTHSVNFEWGLESYNSQLQAVSRLLAAHSGPAILAGDFNTWSRERLAALLATTQANGLDPVGFTPDQRTRAFGFPLDHIFIRGLVATDSGTLLVSTSDHNPMWAALSLEESSPASNRGANKLDK